MSSNQRKGDKKPRRGIFHPSWMIRSLKMPTWPAPKTKFLFFDEATNDLHRVLIDTYPVTKECRAKDIFDLMLRERAKNLKIKNPYAFIE